MSSSITELANALREAANSIEKAQRFQIGEDVDIAKAVMMVRSLKPKNGDATITLKINIPSSQREEVTVEYQIDESYHARAKASSFAALLESYTASKEGNDSLASVARLVKKACEPEKTIASPQEVA